MSANANVIASFSEEQTARLTGITKSQLRYWDNTDFYKPSYSEENRRIAYSRIYSFKDIVALRILNILRNKHNVSLLHLRQVSDRLCHLEADPDRWILSKLYVLNRRVIWNEPETEMPQEIVSKQYLVPTVLIQEVISDTKRDIAKFRSTRDKSQIGHIKKNRYVNHNIPVLSGTRIPVSAIKRYSKAGFSNEKILSEYPDLTIDDIKAAIEYDAKPTVA